MFLLFSATASAQIKRLIMAGSVGKLENNSHGWG